MDLLSLMWRTAISTIMRQGRRPPRKSQKIEGVIWLWFQSNLARLEKKQWQKNK
jgi:hypothetical protein